MNCANHPGTEALVVFRGNSLCKECYESKLQELYNRPYNAAASEMKRLWAVYEAADIALHSDVIGSNPENIERLAEAVSRVQQRLAPKD